MKTLPGNAAAERRVHLERYIHAWLCGHAMMLSDLAQPEVRDRLLKTLSADLGSLLGKGADAIAMQIGMGVMKVGTNLLQKGVTKLLDWGGDSAQGKGRSGR